MAPKRATLYTYGNDDLCTEVQQFIEEAGILLTVRDIGKEPFTPAEFYELVGNLNLEHFINPASEAFPVSGNGHNAVDRRKLYELVKEDPTVLRRPILRTTRLVTIGADRRKIAEALQFGTNGSSRESQNTAPTGGGNRRARA